VTRTRLLSALLAAGALAAPATAAAQPVDVHEPLAQALPTDMHASLIRAHGADTHTTVADALADERASVSASAHDRRPPTARVAPAPTEVRIIEDGSGVAGSTLVFGLGGAVLVVGGSAALAGHRRRLRRVRVVA
jgi:hypothetical protein